MQELILPEYTRVSTILSVFQAYSFVPTAKLKRAQDIGTDIHEAIEHYFKDGFTPLDSKRGPYFDSFLWWADIFIPTPLLFEERFYDQKLMITGRIDLLCKIEGIPHLIDFKTGSWAHPEIWELQMTFYRYLLEVNEYPVLPNRFLVLQLDKEGREPVKYEFKYDERNLEICLCAWRMWKYFQKHIASN